jgi:hypothetical protein
MDKHTLRQMAGEMMLRYGMAFGKALILSAICGCMLLFSSPHGFANSAHIGPVKAYIDKNVRPWLSDPLIIQTLKAQNAANADLSDADIAGLNNEWIAEVESDNRPMIDKAMSSPISAFLKARGEEASGTITEIILMDAHGMNAGQSDVTSDFWQGDEDKFTKAFAAGTTSIFVDEARKDDSTQMFQSQASMTILDESGEAIGAITIGINLDQL